MMDFEKEILEENIYFKNKIDNIIARINKNNMTGYYADNKNDALELVKRLICKFNNGGGGIGIGDSKTLHQIHLFDWLYSEECKNLKIFNTFERLEDGRFSEFKNEPNAWIPEETYNQINRKIWEKSRQALLSDVFITGANAITSNGSIVSTDGAGNRIGAVIYGPYKVILVLGRNKIVEDYESALLRIKHIAAPMNHLRHSLKHRIQGKECEEKYGIYKLGKLPCVKEGKCIECGSPLCTRHCTMIMEKGTGGYFKDRIHIILVNEELGL